MIEFFAIIINSIIFLVINYNSRKKLDGHFVISLILLKCLKDF